MAFYQDPPRLLNQFFDDSLLSEFLARALPPDVLAVEQPALVELGGLAGGELFALQQADRLNEPQLVQWDPWGQRVDRLELTAVWRRAAELAATFGIVARAYETELGPHARLVQFASAYLFHPSTDVYTCPLAMTDGAARTLLDLGNQALVTRAVPRLLSRQPQQMWTSGQWMTERTGGSDVGLTQTVARRVVEGPDESYRLYGTKWFSSATAADMALTLARPEGNGPGGRGLALFYVEVRDAQGRYQGIAVNRLKDKLGTRKVPTAELTLDGTPAIPVAGLSDGVRNISSMLNITRTWNAVMSASSMRRALALALDYARRRVAFGLPIAEKPLHQETLADLQAEAHGAFVLAFRGVQLLGRVEARVATSQEQQLFRIVTPLAKLTTGKQAVAVISEVLESCGGAGYVEDTGLPMLLRDAQVLPIWEGTTNVLSLDILRVAQGMDVLAVVEAECRAQCAEVTRGPLLPCVEAVHRTLAATSAWLAQAMQVPDRLEAGARGLALTLGRTLSLALLVSHAAWSVQNSRPAADRAVAAARRYLAAGLLRLIDLSSDHAHDRRALLGSSDGLPRLPTS